RSALPRNRDTTRDTSRARGGRRLESDGIAQRHRQPVYLHDHALPEEPARDHRPGRGAGRDGGRDPQRRAPARRRMSAATWQVCAACGSEISETDPHPRCPRCGGLLEVRHRPPPQGGHALRATFDARPAVWCASPANPGCRPLGYAAVAGRPAVGLVPKDQVAAGKLGQALAYGARTLLVRGNFDDCLELADQASERLGVYLLNSVNPFRLEGQKTIVFELLQQLSWDPPDWIVVPAGNLGNTAAFGKALEEGRAWGLIDRVPRLAAVQAEGAAPFASSFRSGFARLDRVTPHTLATAISIGNPVSHERAARAIRETNGVVTTVSDDDILEAKAAVDGA